MEQRSTPFETAPNQLQPAGQQSVTITSSQVVGQAQPLLMTQVGPIIPAPIQQTVDRRQKYKEDMYRLGITEIILGALSMIFTIPALAIVSSETDRFRHAMSSAGYGISSYYINTAFTYAAAGIWGGICILTVGILGICIKVNPSKGNYIGNMIMAIVTANITFTATFIAILAAGLSYYSSPLKGLHIAVAFLNAAATISAIVHSALCCCGAFCGSEPTAQPVMYFPAHGNTGYQSRPQYIRGPNGQLLMVLNQPIATQSANPTQIVSSGYPVSPHTLVPPPQMVNTPYPTHTANSGYRTQ